MNFWRWSLFLILIVIFSFSLVVACGDDDDDDDDDDTTEDDDDMADDDTDDDDDSAGCGVADICTYVFSDACPGNNGFDSEQDCNDLWLDGCANTEDYLLCACACLAAEPADCDDWMQNCESGCWTDYCG